MKKTTLILVAVLLSISSFSQSKTSLGFRGGANLSNLSNTELKSKTGFYLSALAQFKISELYTLQPELGYSLQGGDSKNSIDADLSIHYISIGATNKFFIKDSGIHFLIAPGLDFDTDDTFIGLANRTEGNDVTFIDFTIAAGVGIEFKNGIGIEARYKQGVIDVFSGDFHSFDSQQYEIETQFNSVFQLGMTYKFKLGK